MGIYYHCKVNVNSSYLVADHRFANSVSISSVHYVHKQNFTTLIINCCMKSLVSVAGLTSWKYILRSPIIHI